MNKLQILIATTNEQKYREILYFLGDLPFEFITLADISQTIEPPEEVEETIEGNALLKAQYYAKKTGFITLADDTGLFTDALNGWPGVNSARFLPEAAQRRDLVLEKMKDVPKGQRTASFRCALVIADPNDDSFHLTIGEDQGEITQEPVVTEKERACFDTIFFLPDMQKTYSQLSLEEKTAISHRGKALMKIKYYLTKQYGARHIVAPLGLIIRDKKILLGLRNDPFRPTFHRKWEFPGGSMEFGETVEENLHREIEEETGLDTEVVQSLDAFFVYPVEEATWRYQVYLMPYVCRVIGGKEHPRDAEVLDLRWYDLEEVKKEDLIGKNKEIYNVIFDKLKQIVIDNDL